MAWTAPSRAADSAGMTIFVFGLSREPAQRVELEDRDEGRAGIAAVIAE